MANAVWHQPDKAATDAQLPQPFQDPRGGILLERSQEEFLVAKHTLNPHACSVC